MFRIISNFGNFEEKTVHIVRYDNRKQPAISYKRSDHLEMGTFHD